MSQPITVSVTMDAASFRRFRWFDLLQHNRIWKRPLVFTAILLVFAGVCLTQLNTRHEAGLLAGVLAQACVSLFTSLGSTIIFAMGAILMGLAAFDRSLVDVADWVAEDDLLAPRDADAILDRQ